jgi:hypothetical protein
LWTEAVLDITLYKILSFIILFKKKLLQDIISLNKFIKPGQLETNIYLKINPFSSLFKGK